MKIWKFGIFIFLAALIAVSGCSKKSEEVSNLSGLGVEGQDKDVVTQTITSPEIEAQPVAQPQPAPIEVQPLQTQPPAPQMPSEEVDKNKQIQTALKNANLYFGEVDGKIGPLTRKAIEEFQKMKGLKVDGKVGPITWGELQKYLNPAPVAETKKKR